MLWEKSARQTSQSMPSQIKYREFQKCSPAAEKEQHYGPTVLKPTQWLKTLLFFIIAYTSK